MQNQIFLKIIANATGKAYSDKPKTVTPKTKIKATSRKIKGKKQQKQQTTKALKKTKATKARKAATKATKVTKATKASLTHKVT